MNKCFARFAALLCAAVLIPGVARADIMSTVAEADTFLRNDSGGRTATNGSSSSFDVRWLDNGAGTTRVRIGLIRFDISAIDPSEYNTAFLSFGLRDGGTSTGPQTWNVYGLNDGLTDDRVTGQMGELWDEPTVNYENGPGVNIAAPEGALDINASQTSLLGTISYDAPDDVNGANDGDGFGFSSNTTDLDLTAFLSADTNDKVSFLLVPTTDSGKEARVRGRVDLTKELAPPPTLTWGVPEPTSAAMLLLGIAGTMARRRR